MKFCKRCVMPDTKPNLNFDEDGICDACRSQEVKNRDIDWCKVCKNNDCTNGYYEICSSINKRIEDVKRRMS